MRAGPLKYRVHFEERAERIDQVGEPVPYWRHVASVWAAVEPVGGTEGVTEQQIHAVSTTRFRIRYRPDVHAKLRIRHKKRYFNIERIVEPQWNRQEIQLLCSDGLSDG